MISAKSKDNYNSQEMGIILANKEKKGGSSKTLGMKILAGLSLLFSVAAQGGHASAATSSDLNNQTTEQTPNIQSFRIEYYVPEGIVSHIDCPTIVTSPEQMNKIIIDNVPRGYKINWEPGTSINTLNGVTTIGVDMTPSVNSTSPNIEATFPERYDQESTDVQSGGNRKQQIDTESDVSGTTSQESTIEEEQPMDTQDIPKTANTAPQDKEQNSETDNAQQVIEQPTQANTTPKVTFQSKHADIY